MKKINDDIKKGQFEKLYLLYGSERYLVTQAKSKLLHALNPENDSMNFNAFEGKDIDVHEVISLCQTYPFFAEKRIILIEESGFFKNKCDELADYMKELPDYLCMIFVEKEVDKRSRTYKAAGKAGYISEQNEQDERTLTRWVSLLFNNAGKKISPSDIALFLSKTGSDMNIISTETEKLLSYTMERGVITSKDIEEICSTQIENRIFEMIRSVTQKNQKKALDLYYDLLNLREPPMKILALLSRQYRQLLSTKQMLIDHSEQREIASALGLQSFAAGNLINCAKKYSRQELENAVEYLADADERVKTGRLSDLLSVELFIVKFSH